MRGGEEANDLRPATADDGGVDGSPLHQQRVGIARGGSHLLGRFALGDDERAAGGGEGALLVLEIGETVVGDDGAELAHGKFGIWKEGDSTTNASPTGSAT